MESSLYGQLNSEKLAEEKTACQQIVVEINKFGINDRQRWIIMHLLCLELENIQDMKDMVEFIKNKKDKEIFISKLYDSDGSDWLEQEVNANG
jgi:hypothetical protein